MVTSLFWKYQFLGTSAKLRKASMKRSGTTLLTLYFSHETYLQDWRGLNVIKLAQKNYYDDLYLH